MQPKKIQQTKLEKILDKIPAEDIEEAIEKLQLKKTIHEFEKIIHKDTDTEAKNFEKGLDLFKQFMEKKDFLEREEFEIQIEAKVLLRCDLDYDNNIYYVTVDEHDKISELAQDYVDGIRAVEEAHEAYAELDEWIHYNARTRTTLKTDKQALWNKLKQAYDDL